MSAGTTIPPKAAPKGRIACLKEESSPVSNSLLISIPANRKKKLIRKSLIHSEKLSGKLTFLIWGNSACHRFEYHAELAVLVSNREIRVHRISITPVALLSLIKNRKGLIAFLMIPLILSYFKS